MNIPAINAKSHTRPGQDLWKHKKAKHSEKETIAHSTSPEDDPIPPGSDMPIE